MMKLRTLKHCVFNFLYMFSISCATAPTVACNLPRPPAHDATRLPLHSFVRLDKYTLSMPAGCIEGSGDPCVPQDDNYMASGVFIYRSRRDPTVGFVMTARHFCDHAPKDVDKKRTVSEFFVNDYFGETHGATVYFTSSLADICVLRVDNVQPSISMAEVADGYPDVGSRAYSISAPAGYAGPSMALIFEGIFSGLIGNDAIYTITSGPGSSGAGIFDSEGRLLGIMFAMPTHRTNEMNADGSQKMATIVESISIATSLAPIKDAVSSIDTMDELFGSTMTSSVSH